MASAVCCYTLMTPAGRIGQQHGFPCFAVKLFSLRQSKVEMQLAFSSVVSIFSPNKWHDGCKMKLFDARKWPINDYRVQQNGQYCLLLYCMKGNNGQIYVIHFLYEWANILAVLSAAAWKKCTTWLCMSETSWPLYRHTISFVIFQTCFVPSLATNSGVSRSRPKVSLWVSVSVCVLWTSWIHIRSLTVKTKRCVWTFS